jgi:hypothetical protein
MFKVTFEAIGTQWEIETHQPLGRRLQQRIFERIEQFDAAAPDAGRDEPSGAAPISPRQRTRQRRDTGRVD